VESQIKVRDFSRAQVTIAPSEYASWSEARSDLHVEAKVAHALPAPAHDHSVDLVLCVSSAR